MSVFYSSLTNCTGLHLYWMNHWFSSLNIRITDRILVDYIKVLFSWRATGLILVSILCHCCLMDEVSFGLWFKKSWHTVCWRLQNREVGSRRCQFCMADFYGSSLSSGHRQLLTLLSPRILYLATVMLWCSPLSSTEHRWTSAESLCCPHHTEGWNGVLSSLSVLPPSEHPLQIFFCKVWAGGSHWNTVRMQQEVVIILGNV